MVKLKLKNVNFTNIKTQFYTWCKYSRCKSKKVLIHDVNKVLLSSKASFGRKDYKYLIGYKDGKKVRPLCLMLPKMSAYRRDFDETPYLLFLIRNN